MSNKFRKALSFAIMTILMFVVGNLLFSGIILRLYTFGITGWLSLNRNGNYRLVNRIDLLGLLFEILGAVLVTWIYAKVSNRIRMSLKGNAESDRQE